MGADNGYNFYILRYEKDYAFRLILMPIHLFLPQQFFILSSDGRLLFLTRILRLFAYGFLSVILVIYLQSIGLGQYQIGWLLALTLVGDVAISLGISLIADTVGRRCMLRVGALLMVFAGVLFAFTDNFILLLLAAIIGVISPSGNEVGPFLAIEQASLSHLVGDDKRTGVFAWYNLLGFCATALGALMAGILFKSLVGVRADALDSYKIIVLFYALRWGWCYGFCSVNFLRILKSTQLRNH